MECSVCKTPTSHCCEQCIKVKAYCSESCQNQDWPQHKFYCKPSWTALQQPIDAPALGFLREKFDQPLIQECETLLNAITLNLENIGVHHGDLSEHKARIMLHEGTAHNHPLTDRQRCYFGWVAGGRKH